MSRRGRSAAGLVGLALLEGAWLVWSLTVPLPGVASQGGDLRRGEILARAIPGVLPRVSVARSFFGQAIARLGHVENLPERLPIVLAAALIGGAALALGGLILRGLGIRRTFDALERIALAYGLGASGLGVATLVAGRLGVLAPGPVRAVLGALIAAEAVCMVRDRWRGKAVAEAPREATSWRARVGFLVVVGPFVTVMILGAMLPTIEFDALEYHLQGPKEYYQSGRIAFLPHNVYTSMPFGVEMLHLLGMEVLGDWWWGALVGQVLVAAFAPASAVLIAATAGRWGSPRAATLAALAYLTTPWIYRVAVIPFVEGPLCFYHAALVWAAARAWDAEDAIRARHWAVVGLLAGGAMACKYPALLSAVVPFGLLALVESVRRRSGRIALGFALGWAAIMVPWLARNALDTGNPVYPLGYRVVGARHWDTSRDAKWARAHGRKPVSAALLAASAVDVAGRSDWQSPLFGALVPLAFLRPGSRRQAWALAGYAAYLFLTWWLLTHRVDRFWLPMVPALAVLAGLGADWSGSRAWSILLGMILTVATLANLAFVSTELAGPVEWTGNLRALRSSVPAESNPALTRLGARLPEGAKVLLVGPAAVFPLDRPIVYNTVFNDETIETLTRGRTPSETRRALRGLGVTYMYVDWSEIARYRSPGNYGFTPYVTRERFAGWVDSGVLGPPERLGPRQELYRVR